MQRFTLDDLLTKEELRELGEPEELSDWENPRPIRSEFRRYSDPELTTVTTNAYNMAHKLRVESEEDKPRAQEIEDALHKFQEVVRQRSEENPVFINSELEKLVGESPASAYLKFEEPYPVTLRSYEDLKQVLESEEMQQFFAEESDIDTYQEILYDEFKKDHILAPVLIHGDDRPERLPTGLIYDPELSVTADPSKLGPEPDYSSNRGNA